MREFHYENLKTRQWDKDVLGYIGLIHEYKGKQQLYLKQKPMEFSRLVDIAKIQSTATVLRHFIPAIKNQVLTRSPFLVTFLVT